MENKELREWMNSNYTKRQVNDKLVVIIGNIVGTTEFIKENVEEEEPTRNPFLSTLILSRGKSIRTEEMVIKSILDYMYFQYYDLLLKIYREQQIDKLI